MLDLVVVGGYFVILLLVGWRARKGSPDAYWVAERRYGGLPVAASLVATIFGASSTLGIIGLGYSRGLTGAWWSLVGGVALVPFALILAPRVRRLEVYTLPDILEAAYGRGVAVAGAGVISLAWCGVVAAQLVAGAYLLSGVFPLSFHASLGIIAVVFTLYTLWGGQLSVIRTDSWQIILFVGGLATTLFLVGRVVMGTGGAPAEIPGHLLLFPVSPGFGWYELLVFYPLIVGMPYLVGPDIYTRVLCARDGGTARRAALLAAAVVIPVSFLMALLGVLIRTGLPGLEPDMAFSSAVSAFAPGGLRGLIVVGVLGAIMSSADTTLVSASTILSLNVARPLVGLEREGAHRLTRILVVVVGGVAWALAAFQEGIIPSLLLAYTVFVGGVAVPTLASFWRERLGVTPTAALWAVLVGGGSAVMGEVGDGILYRALPGDGAESILVAALGPEYGSILPVILSAVVLLAVSRLSRSPGSHRAKGGPHPGGVG